MWWCVSVGRSSSREVCSVESAVNWPELNQIEKELVKETECHVNREDASWLEDRRRREQVTRSGQAVGEVSPGRHPSSLGAILR